MSAPFDDRRLGVAIGPDDYIWPALPPAVDPVASMRANVARVSGEIGALLDAAAARRPAACGRTPHWTAGYIGLPYVPMAFDCAHLVERVQREVFGRDVRLPGARPGDNRSAQMQQMLQEHAPHLVDRIEAPEEGAAALMVGAGRLNHVGVCTQLAGEWWVLHNFIRARQVVLHRLRELGRWGLVLEGVYQWR